MSILPEPIKIPGPRHYQDRYAELGPGRRSVRLVREPTNTHDPNAIMVLDEENTKLGYIPRQRAALWSERMDAAGQIEMDGLVEILAPPPGRVYYLAQIVDLI